VKTSDPGTTRTSHSTVSGVIEDLGEVDEIDVIEHLVPVNGLSLLDVGCGDARLARKLVSRGATVIGMDPDLVQMAANKGAEPVSGLSFLAASAEALPIEEKSVDGVVFCLSLHHVPQPVMKEALEEAMRVLRPESGFVCVLEPLTTGSLETLYQPFHDETLVRRAAYEALLTSAAPRFAEARELRYGETERYDGFSDFLETVRSLSYLDVPAGIETDPRIRAAFEAGATGSGYAFTQHVRVNFFRKLI
jgi:ubiquinone/menaquinone biosynthesis C-methylase UbiE